MSSATSGSIWRWERGADGVWTLWFDQPGRSQNVLDPAALDELETRLVEAEGEHALQSLVIRNAKPKGFCAGADLGTILSCRTAADVETFVRRGLAVFDRLSGLAVPTVAVIHGVCLGGGLELALACRRRVALASAEPLQIGTPEVHHGLIPAWGAIDRLPRLMGPDDGLDLLISGRLIGYLLARSHGLVDRLAAEADLEESVELDRVLGRPGADVAEGSVGIGLEPRARPGRGAAGGSSRGPAQDTHHRRDRRCPRPRRRPRGHRTSPGRAGDDGLWFASPWRLPVRAFAMVRAIGVKTFGVTHSQLATQLATVQLDTPPISSPSPIM